MQDPIHPEEQSKILEKQNQKDRVIVCVTCVVIILILCSLVFSIVTLINPYFATLFVEWLKSI